MSIGATGSATYTSNIAIETVRKANDVARVEGKAVNKLLEGAGEVAKKANTNPERGQIIDILA